MTKVILLSMLSIVVFAGSAFVIDTAQAQTSMLCKLESQRVVQGKERHCLYRCADGTIEGRIRRMNQECLKTVYSAN